MAEVPKVGEGEAARSVPTASRMTLRETADGLGIHVPAERNGTLIIFLTIWLAGWTVGEVLAFVNILGTESLASNAFLIFWLVLWTFGGLLAFWMLLWQFFGTERLFITGGALVHAAGVGALRREKVHPVDKVRNLRIEEVGKVTSTSNGHRKRTAPIMAITFEVDGDKTMFGTGMNDLERAAAFAAIRRHLPQVPPDEAPGARNGEAGQG